MISRLHSVTLTAAVQGTKLAPETYRESGQLTYVREVPPALLSENVVRVDFALDKAWVPGRGDDRELGLVAIRVGLDTK
jgi:hypothetical protein